MTCKTNILEWLQFWMKAQCDGEWEHENGVKIENTDNPGWYIKIDLVDTTLENINIPWKLHDNGKNDWYGYKVENNEYFASGDIGKLAVILEQFKLIVHEHDIPINSH